MFCVVKINGIFDEIINICFQTFSCRKLQDDVGWNGLPLIRLLAGKLGESTSTWSSTASVTKLRRAQCLLAILCRVGIFAEGAMKWRCFSFGFRWTRHYKDVLLNRIDVAVFDYVYACTHLRPSCVRYVYILYVYISDCSVLLVQSVISIVLKSHPELNDRRMGLPSLAFRFRCVRKPSDVISRLAVKATRKISQPIEVSLFLGRQLTYQA